MTKNKRIKAYEKLFNAFGHDIQITMCIEEMSELTKELCKNKRGSDNRDQIIEEIADVLIVLEEMQYLYMISECEIDYIMHSKIVRGLSRIPNKTTL